MPSVSKSQQRLMGAAEHGAKFPMAEKVRESMNHKQMHDFASGKEKGKPEHVHEGRGYGKDMKHGGHGRHANSRGGK